MAEAMRSVGLSPQNVVSDVWRSEDWSAFVEVHIEQGTVLDHEATELGVVDVISGSTRLQVTIQGVASHSGGAPMASRHDALTAAAECVLVCESLASDYEHHGTRITVGRMEVHPGSITTIPGKVRFTVDIRDIDNDRQLLTAQQLVDRFEDLCRRRGTGFSVELLADTSPVRLSGEVAAELLGAIRDQGIAVRVVTSGASHDSQQINKVVPTGMIFVPSANGLSHVPEEFTATAHLERAARALLAAMHRLDGA